MKLHLLLIGISKLLACRVLDSDCQKQMEKSTTGHFKGHLQDEKEMASTESQAISQSVHGNNTISSQHRYPEQISTKTGVITQKYNEYLNEFTQKVIQKLLFHLNATDMNNDLRHYSSLFPITLCQNILLRQFMIYNKKGCFRARTEINMIWRMIIHSEHFISYLNITPDHSNDLILNIILTILNSFVYTNKL